MRDALLVLGWGLVVAWGALAVLSRRAASRGPVAAARWAGALLVLTVVASAGTCVAPVAFIVSGFGDVARAQPSNKGDVLAAHLDAARPLLPLALFSLLILIAGGWLFFVRRRRAGRAAAAQAERIGAF